MEEQQVLAHHLFQAEIEFWATSYSPPVSLLIFFSDSYCKFVGFLWFHRGFLWIINLTHDWIRYKRKKKKKKTTGSSSIMMQILQMIEILKCSESIWCWVRVVVPPKKPPAGRQMFYWIRYVQIYIFFYSEGNLTDLVQTNTINYSFFF